MSEQITITDACGTPTTYVVKDWEKLMLDNKAEALRITAFSGIQMLVDKVWQPLHQIERPAQILPTTYVAPEGSRGVAQPLRPGDVFPNGPS